MDTIEINKEDCSFSVLQHSKIRTAIGSAYLIEMCYNSIKYYLYNIDDTFRTDNQVSSIACPRCIGKVEGKRIVEALPNQLTILA